MTGDRERFGEEIDGVVETADEEDTKVSLADPVSVPMQAHVRYLRHPMGDRVGSNADSHLVVTKQRGGGLGVAYVGAVLKLQSGSYMYFPRAVILSIYADFPAGTSIK
jgi:hypothetical protein